MSMEIMYLQADVARLERQLKVLEESQQILIELMKRQKVPGVGQAEKRIEKSRRAAQKREEEIAQESRLA